MNYIHIVTAVIGIAVFITGVLMALPDERAAGRALIMSGAIIIVGVIIASAINEAKR